MRTAPRTLVLPPLRLLLLVTWSPWAQRAIWPTFLAALSHPVARDGDAAVAQTVCPATTFLDMWGTEFSLGSSSPNLWARHS